MILAMLKVLIFSLCVSVALAVIIFVPLCIYLIPYNIWIGFQNTKGLQKDKNKEGVISSTKNASRLYFSWISRREPKI